MVSRLIVATITCLVVLSLMACNKGKEEQASQEEGQQTLVASILPTALQDEIAAWRAVGGVIDIRDLAPKPPTAGARNAADLHRSMENMFTNLSPADTNLLIDPWAASVSSLKYLVEFYAETLLKIHEAVVLPYCNWETRLEDGNDADITYLYRLRSEARLLVVDAIVRADKGDLDGAAQSIVDIMRLGDQAASESITIAILVRNSLDALATDSVRRMFKGRETVPTIINEALARRDYRACLRRALICEGAVAVWEVRKAGGGDLTRPIEQQTIPRDLADGLVWYLKTLRSFVEQSDQPYYRLTSAVQLTPMPVSARLPEGLSKLEDIERICKVIASVENQTAVAQLALQLRGHKAKNGEYPESRNFQTPMDALTGQPISYTRSGAGFVLRASMSGVQDQSAEVKWEW